MLKIYDVPESSHEGAYDEPGSPNERACLRYMLNRSRHRKLHELSATQHQMRGMFKIYMTKRNRQMRGCV